ncbi:MAG TPA: SDR family oxidoreductase [Polyangia bacterium]|jgi:NADP-dependent 3-hydroxy acid dehydrogenase YdfG|nr:SDR family oxidoreductase [Polyangia bacterium]
MSMKDRVVVITGASAGIGAVLAERVGQRGARVVLVARREPELAEVARRAGAQALPVVADVTRRQDLQRVLDAALARFDGVDVWINNAGRGISRVVSELTDADFDEMMLVNVKSVLYGMQVVLPHFRARGRGHIINISSMLGRVPFAPFRSAYSAAKHAVNALSANLRMELRATDPEIHVSVVHPGIVATEFGVRALHGGPDSRQLPNAQSPEAVADVIAGVIDDPRADVYTFPDAQKLVAAYFAADDMAAFEAQSSFGGPPPRRP